MYSSLTFSARWAWSAHASQVETRRHWHWHWHWHWQIPEFNVAGTPRARRRPNTWKIIRNFERCVRCQWSRPRIGSESNLRWSADFENLSESHCHRRTGHCQLQRRKNILTCYLNSATIYLIVINIPKIHHFPLKTKYKWWTWRRNTYRDSDNFREPASESCAWSITPGCKYAQIVE